MTDGKLCPKCDGRMEIGTIASYNAPYRNSIRLIKGTPKAGFFGRGYVKVQDHEYPLLAYVCLGCGYTEFYSELSRPF